MAGHGSYVPFWGKPAIQATPPGKYKVYGLAKLLLGRVVKQTVMGTDRHACVKVEVSRNEFDAYLNMFFRRKDDFWAHDKQKHCRVGDVVLIRQSAQPISVTTTHNVEKVIHPYGQIVDPVTNRRVYNDCYEDRVKYKHKLISDIIEQHGLTSAKLHEIADDVDEEEAEEEEAEGFLDEGGDGRDETASAIDEDIRKMPTDTSNIKRPKQ